MSEPLIGGSLFTGYGGLDMAADLVLGPIDFTWHSDIKPASRILLEHRYPGVPNLGDITTLDPRDVSPVHLLTFGWPCPPFSAAGKRLGEADPRALWPHVHRIIDGLRPPLLLGENVSRVVSVGELRRVVYSLAEIGYVGLWRCVRASDVGAPHRRDRLFLLGFRADSLDAVAHSVRPELRDQPERSCRTCGTGAGVPGNDGTQRTAELSLLLPTPTARLGDASKRGADPARYRGPNSMRGHRSNLDDMVAAVEQRSPWMLDRLLPTPAVADSRNTRNATAGRTPENDRHHSGWTLSDVAYADHWGQYAPAIHRWEHELGRPAPDPTQLGTRGQQVLAPAFVEWMIGLPAGWVTDVPGLTRSQQLSLLGDGVVPQQGAHAFQQLIDSVYSMSSEEAAS